MRLTINEIVDMVEQYGDYENVLYLIGDIQISIDDNLPDMFNQLTKAPSNFLGDESFVEVSLNFLDNGVIPEEMPQLIACWLWEPKAAKYAKDNNISFDQLMTYVPNNDNFGVFQLGQRLSEDFNKDSKISQETEKILNKIKNGDWNFPNLHRLGELNEGENLPLIKFFDYKNVLSGFMETMDTDISDELLLEAEKLTKK